MNVAEIIQELPKLSHQERRKVAEAAWSYGQEEEMAWAMACTEEAFLMLDKMEAEDEAKNQAR